MYYKLCGRFLIEFARDFLVIPAGKKGKRERERRGKKKKKRGRRESRAPQHTIYLLS